MGKIRLAKGESAVGKTVAIVSLSAGTLGEDFVRHELELGRARLEAIGLAVKFAPHALMGRAYLAAHPEARAADLLWAFRDRETDLILSAIGGDDTYRLLPWLFDHGELAAAVTDKPFLGFSDTTMNHLMLHKVGLNTFYGQAFLPDVCELGGDMLPYSRRYFEELLATGTIRRVEPSDVWYEERSDFSPATLGTPLAGHPNGGFQLLQGPARFSGPILGGCLDTLFDLFDGGRYADSPALCRRYGLFPTLEDWRGKLLLLETSEERPTPEKYRRMVAALKGTGMFRAISGILVGKPIDGTYEEEYRRILVEEVDDPALPILWNLNVGHANPRCILPLGVPAHVDAQAQRIEFFPG